MKRHVTKLIVFALALVSLSIIACADEEAAARSSLRLNMESAKALGRTLLPDDTPLSVSRYIVEGDGPQGSTFSVVSTNASVEVQGLLIGNWSLTAVGQNAVGVDLVRGTKTVNLTKEPTETVIELDTLAGTGVMDIEFYWDSTQISEAALTLYLKDKDGEQRLLNPTTNNSSNGSVRYTATLSAGSYLLQAYLDSGSIRVAGCVEVVRIVGARTTEARIELRLDKYSDVPNTVRLLDHLGQPIECTIGGVSETMVAQKSATATVTTGGEQPVNVDWYLDGELVAQGPSCTFTPTSGTHRLDVIAQGVLLASSGSASISFVATVDAQSGVPALINRVGDNTNGISIAGGSQVAFLPDGKFLLANPTLQTLQVCRIVRDSVEVVHTYTSSDSFNLAGELRIFVDQLTYRVVISNSTNPKVALYQYDLSTSTLTKLFEKGNNYGNSEWGSGTFPYLDHFAVDRTLGALYGLHPSDEIAVQMNIYALGASDFHNPYYWAPFPPGDGKRYTGLDISPSGEYTALTKASDSLLMIFRRTLDFGGMNFASFIRIKAETTPYINAIREVLFLDDSNLVYATSKDLGRFNRTGSNAWEQEEVFTNGVYGTPAMDGIIALKGYKKAGRLYALCTNSRNVVAFTFAGGTSLTLLDCAPLGIFDPSGMDISPKGDHLVVTSASSAEILLFRILE